MSFWWKNTERRWLKAQELPKHVAIIMDGNGTWAKRRGLPRTMGHARGAESLRRAMTESIALGIPYLSVYAFSTENWKRPKAEVDYLMELFWDSLQKEIPALKKNKITIRFIGGLEKFKPELRSAMHKAEQNTALSKPVLTLLVMVNYGGRDEILRATNKAIAVGKPLLVEADFNKYLQTSGVPDPDLLIRTSGQLRVSNFLLWQIAYAEIWVTKTLWPDFNGKTFRIALKDYLKRQRRLGGI